jgi:hypothetical protein
MALEYHLHRLCKPWGKGKSPQEQLLHQKLDLLLVQLHLRNQDLLLLVGDEENNLHKVTWYKPKPKPAPTGKVTRSSGKNLCLLPFICFFCSLHSEARRNY